MALGVLNDSSRYCFMYFVTQSNAVAILPSAMIVSKIRFTLS